jgi:uncharacterized hydrophobic protein (TIGR00341 family)
MMALRMLEIVVPNSCADDLVEKVGGEAFPQILELWTHSISENRSSIKILLDAESTESLTDALASLCDAHDSFRIVLLPVEATVPRVEEPAPSEPPLQVDETSPRIGRVSREELHADLSDSARFTRTFLVLTILSAVVAVIGLTRSNVAIIIGAMVIAPFLGPNVALSLATALADIRLAWQSLRALVLGLLVAFAIAVAAGLILRPDPSIPEILSRTTAGWGDIALAIAAGAAGGLAYTTAVPTALVGVMVAVALLPPWVVFGMLLGSGHFGPALGALALAGLNIICLNLAGVLTFVLQGVSPEARWEAKKARRMSTIALSIWLLLLAGLIALLLIVELHTTVT